MITIFDELSDYGNPSKLITRLKDEWLARLSEFEDKLTAFRPMPWKAGLLVLYTNGRNPYLQILAG